jgi:hypothetical protein
MMWKKPLVAVMLAATLDVASAFGQLRLGGEFQVNTYTTFAQSGARVASDDRGNFVVVWTSQNQDGSSAGVFARRFDRRGNALGAGDFRVNGVTSNVQTDPSAAFDPSGGLVIVWAGRHFQDSDGGVFARRYDPAGLPVGGEFRVNSYTTYAQFQPVVAAYRGGFMVAWTSAAEDEEGDDVYDVFAQRFDSSGLPAGPEFRVNSYTTGRQVNPAVDVDAQGNFVVVWQSHYQFDAYGSDLFGQRYDAAGSPVGGEFLVNFQTGEDQRYPTIAVHPSGNFVVAWDAPSTSGHDIFARQFDVSGTAQGHDFQVNSHSAYMQRGPSIAGDADGNFVVTWQSDGPDGSNYGVFGQMYDAAGVGRGNEFQINSYITSFQGDPSVASDANGNFVVAWTSYDQSGYSHQDGDEHGVFGQRFGRFAPDHIFQDGFEAGTLTAWSSAAADGGDLAVSPFAAMDSTSLGVQGTVDDTVGLYVQDETPVDEPRYRARFHFDPNGFDPGEASNHRRTRIFIAFSEAPTRRVIAVVLRRLSGAYAVMGRVRQDDNSQMDTGFLPISNAPHAIELSWTRSSGADAADGTFEMWIDGTSVATLAGGDNNLAGVDFVRLGALSVKSGASGVLYWDEFVSRRESYIGP